MCQKDVGFSQLFQRLKDTDSRWNIFQIRSMSGDIRAFIEEQRRQILEEKQRLGLLNKLPIQQEEKNRKNEESLQSTNAATQEKNKENQVSKEVEKSKKNWVVYKSAKNPLKTLDENRDEKFTCRDVGNEVKKYADKRTTTRCADTSKNTRNINALEKENDVNFCNTKLDKLNRQNLSDNNEKNKEITDRDTIKSIESNDNIVKTNELRFEDSNKQVKATKKQGDDFNEKQVSVIDKDSELNKRESALKLDLKELIEDDNSGHCCEDKENYTGFIQDASFGLHARSGPQPPGETGGVPMDHAYPLLPRPILRRGEYSNCHAYRYQQRPSDGGDALRRAEPHCGVGEYELSRALFAEKRRRDYLRHLAKLNETQSKSKLVEDSIKLTESEPKLVGASSGFKKFPEKDSDVDPSSSKSVKSVQTELIPDKSLESQSSKSDKSVQTDIQNIHSELVQHDLRFKNSPIKEYSPRTLTDDLVDLAYRKRPYRRIDQRLTSAENELLLTGIGVNSSTNLSKTSKMDKPKSILSNRRTGSPRNRYLASDSYDDYESGYAPSNFLDGFSYSDRSEDLERERIKRENYQHDLRVQIEEKRRLQDMRAEQERRERELENKRLEQQILRIREEAAMEDSRIAKGNDLMRRHSDDLMRRKHELQLERRPWRRHADSESGALDTLGLGTSPALSSHYSPPVSRRVPYSLNVPSTSVFAETSSRYNPSRFESASYSSLLRSRDTSLNRMDSLSSYDTNTIPFSHRSRKFDRFDSLSRIDSLSHRLDSMNVRDEGYASTSARLSDIERRHSATQQDLSLSSRRSPRSRRRNSSSRFDDSLPFPVLKARSPVAKELKNSIPFSSARSIGPSDALRRLEDRWQIPAVQKNILHTTSVSQPESPSGYHSRGSILTQLGSIRSQLQREQFRMDETLRRRGLVRARSSDYGGY